MSAASWPQPWLKTYESLGLDWHHVPTVPNKSLSDYIAEYANTYADRAGLVYLNKTYSYKTLDELATRLAHGLRALGCQAGDVLGIHMPNTPQYVLGFIAASRLNMVVTSISALLTPPEIIHQANDAKVKVLMSFDQIFNAIAPALSNHIPSLSHVIVSGALDLVGQPVTVDNNEMGEAMVLAFNDALSTNTATIQATTDLDAIIFLQYTGGTTGKSKGARLSLRNIFGNNLQVDIFNQYQVGTEVIASAFPLFHIGGSAVMHNAMRVAATLIIVPDPRNVEHFTNEMRAHPPTVIANVPALFQMLMAHEPFTQLDFSQLRLAISGAAPFTVPQIQALEKIIGVGKIGEVFGMTETSPVQTCNPPHAFKPGSVGVPVPGTELRIVDIDTGRDMPMGEPGEIIVSGPQVMAGYLAGAEADASALRDLDGRRWMFTGDVGRFDEDGYVYLCDRSKDMLIVGGYKVFSVEVESKVQTIAGVAMSALVGRPDQDRPGNDIARLYVQLLPGTDEAQTREAILSFCRANMAPYKVPKEIQFIAAIPLTSVGKIDKKKLRAEAAQA